MNLVSETVGDALVVRVGDTRIDAAVAIQFKDRMRDMTTGFSGRIILDLGQVGFVDSSGLGAIVAVMNFLPRGSTMELAALTPNVDKVFRLTRMDSIFAIHDTAPAADPDRRYAH